MEGIKLTWTMTIRNTGLAVAGAVVLVLKPLYHGPLEDLVYAYAGNFAVSFALYFATVRGTSRYRHGHLLAALATLAADKAQFDEGSGITGIVDEVVASVSDPAEHRRSRRDLWLRSDEEAHYHRLFTEVFPHAAAVEPLVGRWLPTAA